MIPAEAVEAVARGMWIPDELDDKWEDLHDQYKEYLREMARAALEAAAPHMLAHVWDDALEAGEHWCRDLNPSEIPNPYRPTK